MRRSQFIARLLTRVLSLGLTLSASAAAIAQNAAPPQVSTASTPWIQPHADGDPLIWGRKDGIVFGLPSPGGLPGPRGLIRVGIVSPTTGDRKSVV